jgi:hypothetical protein
MAVGARSRGEATATGAARILLGAVLGLTAFVALAPVVFNGFVELYDDGVNFLRNPAYRGLGGAQFRWAWSTILLGTYQPMGWMLLELEYAIWGLEPWGYHLVSLLLHAANAIALFGVTLALLNRISTVDRSWNVTSAALAVAIFAVHPLRVEAVAWASSQPYLPSFLFALLAVLAYVKAHPQGGPRQRAWLIGAWVCLAVALLFKSIVISVPVVLIILDVYPLRRFAEGRPGVTGVSRLAVWVEKLPFLAASAVFAAIAAQAKGRGIRMPPLPDGVGERVTQGTYAACFYLIKTVWPFGLSADYPLPNRPHALDLVFLASLVAVVVTTVAVVIWRRRWPGIVAAWVAYLAMLAPTSGLVRTNAQVATDRYSYWPLMAAAVAAAYVFSRAERAHRGRVAIVWSGLAATVFLTTLSWRQCRTWRDDVALFHRAVAVSPAEPQCRVYLGSALERQGKLGEAEAEYLRATELDPRFASALNNLGILRYRERKYDEAKAYFTRAVELDPASVESHTNVGIVLAAQGNPAEAIASYETALRLNPDDATAHRGLAEALDRRGRLQEALGHYVRAYRLDPLNPATQSALQQAIERSGRSRSIVDSPADQ